MQLLRPTLLEQILPRKIIRTRTRSPLRTERGNRPLCAIRSVKHVSLNPGSSLVRRRYSVGWVFHKRWKVIHDADSFTRPEDEISEPAPDCT